MNLLDADPAVTAVGLEHLCDFAVRFSDVHVVSTPAAIRLIAVIGGGTVDGPRLRGRFLPGGGDWVTFGTDGVGRLDVRATIRTDDGELVLVTSTGRAALPDEAVGRLMAGEVIAADEMHARSAPLFETGAAGYAWLNSTVAVAVNELSLEHVNYRVYSVL